jgi:hypothetical protein
MKSQTTRIAPISINAIVVFLSNLYHAFLLFNIANRY